MSEQWRPIPSFADRYEVSDLGRVRTAERVIPYIDGRMRRVTNKIRRASLDTRGYPSVNLTGPEGVKQHRAIHSLVAEAWIGPRPDGAEVCHNDGDKTNNLVSNLRYDSRRENALDVVRHGYHHEAIKTHCKHGHPFSEENTYRNAGRRHCRTCVNERLRRSKAKRRAANRAAVTTKATQNLEESA